MPPTTPSYDQHRLYRSSSMLPTTVTLRYTTDSRNQKGKKEDKDE